MIEWSIAFDIRYASLVTLERTWHTTFKADWKVWLALETSSTINILTLITVRILTAGNTDARLHQAVHRITSPFLRLLLLQTLPSYLPQPRMLTTIPSIFLLTEVGTEGDDVGGGKKVERSYSTQISAPINNSTRTRTVRCVG
jgi:hypothetical protein